MAASVSGLHLFGVSQYRPVKIKSMIFGKESRSVGSHDHQPETIFKFEFDHL